MRDPLYRAALLIVHTFVAVMLPPTFLEANDYDLLAESEVSTEALVFTYFDHDDAGRALAVIACESAGDPDAKNPHSTASGLFQHLASMWPERSGSAGWAGSDVFDPEANVAVAAWLVYHGGGWSHWDASRGCWAGNEVPVVTVDLVDLTGGDGPRIR